MKNKKARKATHITIISLLIAGGVAASIETTVDHVHYYCPFTKLLGLEHQMNVINYNGEYSDSTAILRPEETIKNVMRIAPALETEVEIDGEKTTIYKAPEGFTLDGDMAISTEDYYEPERVEVYDSEGKVVSIFRK